mmetsp:Transcript_42189/g.101486  ORF Transcript_42189/g.101486 Transcript_42189/m.101486 type:complete len:223 (-) Transcript_42189:96-764(-)
MVTRQASQASWWPTHFSSVAGFSWRHLGPSQETSRVLCPGPHRLLQGVHSPTVYSHPRKSSQGLADTGFRRMLQSSSWPLLQVTERCWLPSPHLVEHTVHSPVSQRVDSRWAEDTAVFSHPSCMGTGTPSWPFKQSGGFSQTILHSGFGQSLGFRQSQSHTGSGQTVLHPVSAWAQSTTHLGLSHLVEHFGHPITLVPLGQTSCSGQNIAQFGWPHLTLHPS